MTKYKNRELAGTSERPNVIKLKDDENIENLQISHKTSNINIYIEKQIYCSEDKCVVYSGAIKTKSGKIYPIIAKYKKSSKLTIENEIKRFKRLSDLGCPLPWYNANFIMNNEQILVMEKLNSLNKKQEDLSLLARDVLDQLRFIHVIGPHCDIKPANILKRVEKYDRFIEDKNRDYTYFLIDFEGIPAEVLGAGFRRKVWTKNYIHEDPTRKYCLPIDDFYELIYTLNNLDLHMRDLEIKGRDHCEPENIKNISLSKAYLYIKNQIPKTQYLDDKYYYELYNILRTWVLDKTPFVVKRSVVKTSRHEK